MAERINRGHNKLKPWERLGKITGAAALGALALAGCASETMAAGHGPDRPAASVSATPGSSESSPAPHETTSPALEMQETVLANSSVYNEMTPADQSLVEKDAQLSLDEFEKLPVDERAKVAIVLSDAHSSEYLKAAGELVLPGNQGQKLNHIYVPVKGTYINEADDLYKWELNSTPDTLTNGNNGAPYFQVQFERAIAASMAATGDKSLLEGAKKIIAGTIYNNGSAANDTRFGQLDKRLDALTQMSASQTNTLKDLGYPNAGTSSHFFAFEPDGPFKDHPGTVSVSFEEYDSDTHSMKEGVNSDGAAAAVYKLIKFDTSDGQHRAIWTEMQTASSLDDTSIGMLVPNTTS